MRNIPAGIGTMPPGTSVNASRSASSSGVHSGGGLADSWSAIARCHDAKDSHTARPNTNARD